MNEERLKKFPGIAAQRPILRGTGLEDKIFLGPETPAGSGDEGGEDVGETEDPGGHARSDGL